MKIPDLKKPGQKAPILNRRVVLKAFTAMSLLPVGGCAISDAAGKRTGRDAEGPFYPVVPIPDDSSLIVGEQFAGDELEFHGRVFDVDGKALSGTRIEIWQCDGNSVYHHPSASNSDQKDPGFRGFGAMLTSDSGEYRFRTIVPVPYPGRPPHIHIKLWRQDKHRLTTQVYLEGHGGSASRKMKPGVINNAQSDSTAPSYVAGFDFVI